MSKAMNFTYGDLIVLEIAVISYMKDLDLSMQSGQYISELLGKMEYELAQLRQVADVQLGGAMNRPEAPPATGK